MSAVEEYRHQRGDEHFSPHTLGPRAQHWQVCLPSVPPPSGGMSLQAKATGVHKTESRGRERCTQRTEGPLESSTGEGGTPLQGGREGPQSSGLGPGLHTLAWVENV